MSDQVPVELHIVSDSTGETAARLVLALEAQFPDLPFEEVRHPRVETIDDLALAVARARGRPAVMVYTLVEPGLRDEMRRLCRRRTRKAAKRSAEKKELVGIDIFVQWTGEVDELGKRLQSAETDLLKLQMITNRGVKVWPEGFPETLLTDHWRCRFVTNPHREVPQEQIQQLIAGVFGAGLDFIKAETLCLFDGVPGYSLGQGQ